MEQTSQTQFTSCMHDQMLESNRDDVKLEAMRCVTIMTAKGKFSVPRSLFPHIVKNVSSKNPELRKLIYLYLMGFADQEPDLALLPIATLQKSLKSPNPLVRSTGLKVMTSMRLGILSAILMATVRNSVNDLSPYVRKTVAHSIIKIYRLDPSLKEELVEYVERLLNDKNSMVLSSAVATFNIVCPERYDLIQKHYKRLCFLLADCNEWGQVVLLNLLMRYIIKTHEKIKSVPKEDMSQVDHDPKVLLRSAKPLLHSQNSAVVLAVINLFIAIANHTEIRSTITKPLIRMLYSHREVQMKILEIIEELTSLRGPSEDKELKQNIENTTNVPKDDIIGLEDDINLCPLPETPPEAEAILNEDESEIETTTKDGYIALDSCETIKFDASTVDLNKDEINNDGLNGSKSDDISKTDRNISSECSPTSEDDDDDDDDDESGVSEEDVSTEGDTENDDDDETDSNEEDATMLENHSIEKGSRKDDDDCKVDLDFDLDPLEDPSAYREFLRPLIKSFYVKHNDCTEIRLAKLKILINLSSPLNVNQVLRELQAYIATYVDDREFVSAAIHSIGRCSVVVKEVAHNCLNGLTKLLSNNNEHVVAEAIVVLRSQIIDKKSAARSISRSAINQMDVHGMQSDNIKNETAINNDTVDDHEKETDPDEDERTVSTVIKQVTKLLPSVTAPQARATILWILAEFCQTNLTAAKCAPEVLRSVAKSFCQEDNFVKLQSLTLASKFLLAIDKEKRADLYNSIQLLAGYLFSLSKYDLNHDVRDRGRFLKKLLENEEVCARVLNCAC